MTVKKQIDLHRFYYDPYTGEKKYSHYMKDENGYAEPISGIDPKFIAQTKAANLRWKREHATREMERKERKLAEERTKGETTLKSTSNLKRPEPVLEEVPNRPYTKLTKDQINRPNYKKLTKDQINDFAAVHFPDLKVNTGMDKDRMIDLVDEAYDKKFKIR